jgi:F0F1-type ATP synthase membrane subunit b/b'
MTFTTKEKGKKTMPQLDTATYLSQVFWLLLVFFVFYILVLQFILPKLSTILKVRSKKLNEGSHILEEMSSENKELGAIYDNILTKSLKESERLIQISINGAASWVETSSQKHCAAVNSFYLKSIGNIYAKRGLLRNITK